MAFVIVQHLSMDHESNLAVILSRATDMRVQFLEEDTVPQPNMVYLRPADKDISVQEGKLFLQPREPAEEKLYLPIDNFFLSLAADQGSYAVTVILSGMGSDGSRGIKAVKENGGIVLVQSPESAQFSGMPTSAIRFEVADFVGTAQEIGRTLDAISQRETSGEQLLRELNTPEFDKFVLEIVELIRRELRMDFRRYRPSTIKRRIEKRLVIHLIDDPAAYLEMLRSSKEELRLLAQSFLIGGARPIFKNRRPAAQSTSLYCVPLATDWEITQNMVQYA